MNEIDEIIVTGGRPLHGSVRIQGVKKCGTSGYGSSTLKHRDQCTAGMPENQLMYI